MPEVDDVVEANRRFASGFDRGDAQLPPARPLAILTCIDARLDPAKFLGLDIGDAHVLRNAGGRATDDAIRSLLISSWLLGTRGSMVIHHSDCGMLAFTDQVLVDMIRDKTGQDRSDMRFLAFTDVEESVREDVQALKDDLAFPADVAVTGWVYDVRTGLLERVAD